MTTPFAVYAGRIAALLAITSLWGCSLVLLPSNVAPVVPVTHSSAQAERRLSDVALERAEVNARFAESERLCYKKFFVNTCLNEAKEERRAALVYLRAVEIEAEQYLRQAKVDERDRNVAAAVAQFEAEQDRLANAQAEPEPVTAAPQPGPKPALAKRRAAQAEQAANAARKARIAAQERAQAPRRAAKALEFEQRRLDAQERQRKVAGKQAEKAAKAAAEAD